MVKALVSLVLAISFFTFTDAKASMFPNIDINDPNLTVEIAAVMFTIFFKWPRNG